MTLASPLKFWLYYLASQLLVHLKGCDFYILIYSHDLPPHRISESLVEYLIHTIYLTRIPSSKSAFYLLTFLYFFNMSFKRETPNPTHPYIIFYENDQNPSLQIYKGSTLLRCSVPLILNIRTIYNMNLVLNMISFKLSPTFSWERVICKTLWFTHAHSNTHII